MTKSQEKAIARIKRDCETLWTTEEFRDKCEIKEFTVEELDYSNILFVFAEVGMKGDEGTLAEFFGRDSIRVFIGVRGGITYYPKYRQTRKTYRGFLKTALDQKL